MPDPTPHVVPASERSIDAYHPIEYRGTTFLLPPNPNLVAIEAMELGHFAGFMKALVADYDLQRDTTGNMTADRSPQWRTFSRLFNTDDTGALADTVKAIYGATPGESQASGDS